MDKNNSNKNKRSIKGGIKMALLARNCDTIIIIDKDKSSKFLKESKKNVIKPEFIHQCRKMSAMFKRENGENTRK